jgi:small-conductance mechanosensitive channel
VGRLLEAARAVQGVLVEPIPYVQITSLSEKSVDYTLYFFITDLRKLTDIEATLRREIVARRIL